MRVGELSGAALILVTSSHNALALGSISAHKFNLWAVGDASLDQCPLESSVSLSGIGARRKEEMQEWRGQHKGRYDSSWLFLRTMRYSLRRALSLDSVDGCTPSKILS